MAMLEADDISFAYHRSPVIRDLSLSVARGEMVALAGPNGSGKSTLLRLLSGSLGPSRGEVRLEGREISRMPRRQVARKVALVPQETHLDMPYTAAEVVLMGRAPYLRGLGLEGPADVAVARSAMKKTSTLGLGSRRFSELSGGEKQRVIVARAVAQEPELLLLDEPTAFLDLRHQVDIFELVAKLNAEASLTVVAAMHDLNLAAIYFPRLVFLKEGSVAASGPVSEVLNYRSVRDVFGTEVYVGLNPVTGSINVLPLRKRVSSGV